MPLSTAKVATLPRFRWQL